MAADNLIKLMDLILAFCADEIRVDDLPVDTSLLCRKFDIVIQLLA
jgi:hypothetical protein